MNYHPDFIWTALKMLGALGILSGVLIIALYFAKRIFKGGVNQPRGRMIRVLASAYVGVKKNISLVEVPGAILVLGVTSDSISLLTKIEDEEVLNKFSVSENEKIPGSFSSQLQRFSARYRRDK
ncbi:MAG: flagellar biosynthetic protein FliO [Deltaproteobacteria bacterium]|nr:flagellar biosynthetic protein FliO [Deltaproteobacteria bacterium]MBW2355060.1 flagellar biosynthetic protein FliO [Deltaproteobacteria bacterium]